ncbi:hypothetical protein IZU99_08490 [Oscillospiraceae bacterium CM]|nr:hypothetical protein IZU99_08490 [Oscillospiraceae bacterium CM]
MEREAKIRLSMLFCKTLNEVIFLLQGGFASGALARCRALYETSVFYNLVINNDDLIAEKFMKHCNTNRLKIAKSLSNDQLIVRIKNNSKISRLVMTS